MGSDESRFNVSLIVRDKVRRQCTQTTTFEEREPKRIRTEVLLLTSLTQVTARPNQLTVVTIWMGDRCVPARLCTRPEISLESVSVQTLRKSFKK